MTPHRQLECVLNICERHVNVLEIIERGKMLCLCKTWNTCLISNKKNGFDGFPPLLEHCNWWYCPTSLFPCFRNYFVHLPCRCTFADFNVFCKSLPGRSMQLLQPGIPQLRPQSRLASNPSRGQSPQPLSKLPNLDMTSVSAYWSAASRTTQTRTTMMALKTLSSPLSPVERSCYYASLGLSLVEMLIIIMIICSDLVTLLPYRSTAGGGTWSNKLPYFALQLIST